MEEDDPFAAPRETPTPSDLAGRLVVVEEELRKLRERFDVLCQALAHMAGVVTGAPTSLPPREPDREPVETNGNLSRPDPEPPPVRSGLADALAQHSGGAVWAEEVRRRGPFAGAEDEAQAVALVLQTPPQPPPAWLGDAVCKWAQEYPAAGIRPVAISHLSEDDRARLVPITGAEPGERPGLAFAGWAGRMILWPVPVLPDTPLGRLVVRDWKEPISGLNGTQKLYIGQGDVDEEVLPALLDWCDRQPAAGRDEVYQALARLGVRVLAAPQGADDPHFDRVRELYRPGRTEPIVYRRAVVFDGPGGVRTVRQGALGLPTRTKPAPLDFLEVERQTLLDELAQFGGRILRLVRSQAEAATLEDIDRLLSGYVAKFRDAGERRKDASAAFGCFLQDVLRMSPEPAENPPPWWKKRQEEFKNAAFLFLPELRLALERVLVGQHVSDAQICCDILGMPTRQAGDKTQHIADVRAPALRYRQPPDDVLLKGTVFYFR